MRVYSKYTVLSSVFASLLIIQGCSKKDPEPVFDYTVPTTYNFTNVNYNESATRLVMWAQIETLVNTGNKAGGGANIDGTKLQNMFTNTGNPFSVDSLNKSGLQLKDRAVTAAQSVMAGYLTSQATISTSTKVAAKGTAGVGVQKSGAYLLLDENGHNNRQFFNKVGMGALLANQIKLLINDNTLDNTTVVTGKGTAMEHAWDQAFGYFGVPKDFPTNVTGVKYLGSYCNQVNAGIGSNAIFMNAFLKGRAAISAKDINTKKEQAAIITKELEVLQAAGVIQEVHEAQDAITAGDQVQLVSRLSELTGFVYSLNYFDNRTITDAQINTIVTTNLHSGQLYDLTATDLTGLVTTLSNIYGFTTPDKI